VTPGYVLFKSLFQTPSWLQGVWKRRKNVVRKEKEGKKKGID